MAFVSSTTTHKEVNRNKPPCHLEETKKSMPPSSALCVQKSGWRPVPQCHNIIPSPLTASPANTTGTIVTVPVNPSNSVSSNNSENGCISHRASRGPNLNYLYATDHVDPISSYPSTQPEDDTSNTTMKYKKNKNNKNKPNWEHKIKQIMIQWSW